MDIIKQNVLKINKTFCFNLYCPYLKPGGDSVEAKWSRLRDLREDHDLSQADVAAYLNCTQVSYSYYELGRRAVPVEVLQRLADFYETSVDYLLGRTNERRPYPKP